jgi:hypothetical protein
MDTLAERRMIPRPEAKSARASSAVSASTHHSSARVTSIAAWKTFGCGFGLSFRTADISSSGTNHERKNTLP